MTTPPTSAERSLPRAAHGHRVRGRGRAMTLFIDRAAETVITIGGLAVIAAMVGICVFLVRSAAPLLAVGSARPGVSGRVELSTRPAMVELTPREGELLSVSGEGGLVLLTADGARTTVAPFAPGEVTAWAYEPGEGKLAAAGADGSITIGTIAQRWRPAPAPDPAERPAVGEAIPAAGVRGLPASNPGARLVRTGEDEHRLWDVTIADVAQLPWEGQAAVRRLAVLVSGTRRSWLAAADDGGRLAVLRIDRTRALGGAAGAAQVRRIVLDPTGEHTEPPDALFLDASGPGVVALWRTGSLVRWSGDAEADRWPVSHRASVTPPGVGVLAAAMEVQSRTLLIGAEDGVVRGWSLVPAASGGGDEYVMRHERALSREAGVTSLRPGARDRTVAVGLSDGSAALLNTTSGKIVVRTPAGGAAVIDAAVSGALDELVVVRADGSASWHRVEPGSPEASVRSLAGRLHYEGYAGPRFVYQSTGGGGAEPKLSLVPLVFGTLKATVVAMLLSAPIAVLAALYTSEFLHPSVRRVVKPTIELMASLPSVVLGFVAAVLVAPLMRDYLAGALAAFTAAPVGVLLMSAVWRGVPDGVARRVGTLPRLTLAAIMLAISLGGGWLIASAAEPLLFRFGTGEPGSVRRWLDAGAGAGAAWPGWFALLTPLGVLGAMALDARLFGAVWRARGARTGPREAALQLARTVGITLAGAAMAAVAALLLGAVGLDPRESVLGPFSQRNALVVGLVMGFAVAPIIYTISEDAMQSVPPSLRSASLAAGATPWQTAVRIVLPVAGPGIFSACMIGLGRAVGETMIVLMATGNTPEISPNLFSGFRTLAANIAVELPEAPRGGTHYRVLFLCGLVLFAMTLVVNTTAELVRQRFRRRSAGL